MKEKKEVATQQQTTLKGLFEKDNIKQKITEMLGRRAPQFITSVIQIANSNDMLKNADPVSIFNSAVVAATLDLTLNNNLGLAYIVPYNMKQKDNTWKTVAQFQIGWKGFVRLAQRSGQFVRINSGLVKEGEISNFNRLTGDIEFKWEQDDNKRDELSTVGYFAYFKLLNGYEHTYYMSIKEIKAHAKKYSQTYKKGFGVWNDDFDSMANKTVLKLLLSKYAPLSVDMQRAVITDQSIIKDPDTTDVEYIDNEVVEIDKEQERIRLMIENCETLEELEKVKEQVNTTTYVEDEDLANAYALKFNELTDAKASK